MSYQEHQEHLTKQKVKTPLYLFSLMYWSITTHLLLPSPTRWWGVTKHIMRLGLGGESSAQTGPSLSLWAR